MLHPLRHVIGFGLVIGAVAGCAVVTHGESKSSMPVEVGMFRLPDPNTVIAESKLAPGDYCRINTSLNGIPSAGDQSNEGVNLAGRVVAIDQNRIVLGDVICISKEPATGGPNATKEKPPLLTRIAPRLFKQSGIGHRSIPVDGEIAIDRSTINMISPVDGANWEIARQSGQWFERAGVSFDFNEGKRETRVEVAREVPRSDAALDQSDDFQFSSIPPAKSYDPVAETIQASSLTKDLSRLPERQTYMSVEAINSQMSGSR